MFEISNIDNYIERIKLGESQNMVMIDIVTDKTLTIEDIKNIVKKSNINLKLCDLAVAISAMDNMGEVVKYFIKNGANPNANTGMPWEDYDCLISWACTNGNKDLLEFLLQNGALIPNGFINYLQNKYIIQNGCIDILLEYNEKQLKNNN